MSDDDIQRIAHRVVAEQAAKQPNPSVQKQAPHAKPQEHRSDASKRIEKCQYKPNERKGNHKRRAKGKG